MKGSSRGKRRLPLSLDADLDQGQCQENDEFAEAKTSKKALVVQDESEDLKVPSFEGPYPEFGRPSRLECKDVRDRLLQLHGFPKEFERFRQKFYGQGANEQAEAEVGVSYQVHECVLDSLVCTMLSQNTSEDKARRAFASLKARFPTWDQVHSADPRDVEDRIRFCGLAEMKVSRIRKILQTLLEERGKICLEYLCEWPVDKIKAELRRFKGVGPKTVACLLMFHLKQDDFPVDTHVFHIARSLGWVPMEADRQKAYLHLNSRVPNQLKFDLNCLLITHGKCCPRCSKKVACTKDISQVSCPLLSLLQQ